MATTRKSKTKKSTSARTPSKKTRKKTAPSISKSVGSKKKSRTKVKRVAVSPKAVVATKKRSTASVKAKAPKKVKAKKPPKPRKSAVDPKMLKTIREALIIQRQQLMSVLQTTQAQMADKAVGMADIIDRASEGFEDELALGLMKIEAAQIDDIQAAIIRIDEGTYGLCVDCGKPIPRKRLEVLPFALRCLNCKGNKERAARILSTQDNEL